MPLSRSPTPPAPQGWPAMRSDWTKSSPVKSPPRSPTNSPPRSPPGSPPRSPTSSPPRSPARSPARSPPRSPTRECAVKVNIPKFNVPPNWTTDRAADFYQDWETPDGLGHTVARAFGLGPGRAIMEDNYGVTQIFTDGKKFYLWDEMNDDVYEIFARDVHEIVRTLWNGGQGALKRKPLVQVAALTEWV